MRLKGRWLTGIGAGLIAFVIAGSLINMQDNTPAWLGVFAILGSVLLAVGIGASA